MESAISKFLLQERNAVKVKEDCKRIEGRLSQACSEIKSKYVGKNGNLYKKLNEKELKGKCQR